MKWIDIKDMNSLDNIMIDFKSMVEDCDYSFSNGYLLSAKSSYAIVNQLNVLMKVCPTAKIVAEKMHLPDEPLDKFITIAIQCIFYLIFS